MEKSIKINKSKLIRKYDSEIFSVDGKSFDLFVNHKEIAQKLKSKKPYTITVIIDNLNPKFYNNKKYVEKTKETILLLYSELLHEYFFDEFGQIEGNELYGRWLDEYRPIWKKEGAKKELDEHVIKNELGPRYREKILKKYKNHEKLFQSRTKTRRERYYNLPRPLNYIDWRNPYDNIFIWEENGQKLFCKGGSGSSGGRETNSKFIFGLSLINKIKPIKSYLFLYANNNQLYFIKEFSSLTVPYYDIGSNYFLKRNEMESIISGINLMTWKDVSEKSAQILFNRVKLAQKAKKKNRTISG
ncbi:MAG: hypothetical protein NTZ97_00455 [Candidatus Moranbacteria bacterium]|nr:hypothetical protein [Candidatus Moranbacteria bacterium]